MGEMTDDWTAEEEHLASLEVPPWDASTIPAMPTEGLLAAHKALIKVALARADGERRGLYGRDGLNTPLTEAADAYRRIDPTGSTLARQAAIGAAVERLIDYAPDLVARMVYEQREWHVQYIHYQDVTDGRGPTLLAAIDAALGTKP